MNYSIIYNKLIEKRKLNPPLFNEYSESHHIIPKSLGGKNNKENIVKLYAREHFIAHLLLCKIHKNNIFAYSKMLKAFIMMLTCQSESQNRYVSSRRYESLRQEMSKTMSKIYRGNLNSQFGTMWIHNIKTIQAKKIKKTDIIPEGWEKGRVPNAKKLILNQQYFKKYTDSKTYKYKRKRRLNRLRLKIYHKVKYCKYLLDFSKGEYKSIIDFTTKNKISKNNEPVNSRWKKLFPLMDSYKSSTKGFSSTRAREFLTDNNILNLKELFHFIK
jgi:5-methylcytosine-specific restriction endonuclease McrA